MKRVSGQAGLTVKEKGEGRYGPGRVTLLMFFIYISQKNLGKTKSNGCKAVTETVRGCRWMGLGVYEVICQTCVFNMSSLL